MNKYTKCAFIGFSAVLMHASLNSCAPYPPSHAWGGDVRPNTIDARFVGTWVGISERNTVVLTLAPDGRGKAYQRTRGKFEQRPIKWTTRSNILEIRVGSGSPMNVTVRGNRVHVGSTAPANNVFRYNIVSYRARKFVGRDLSNPRGIDSYYKYSATPTYDAYPVYAWFDNGGGKAIDKNR